MTVSPKLCDSLKKNPSISETTNVNVNNGKDEPRVRWKKVHLQGQFKQN